MVSPIGNGQDLDTECVGSRNDIAGFNDAINCKRMIQRIQVNDREIQRIARIDLKVGIGPAKVIVIEEATEMGIGDPNYCVLLHDV